MAGDNVSVRKDFNTQRAGESVTLFTTVENNEEERENLLDLPVNKTFLAKAVNKSRTSIAASDLLPVKDKNTLQQNLGSTIGYWDSQKRPLESFFSQMNVIASVKSKESQSTIFRIRLYQNGLMSFQPNVTKIDPHSFELNNQTWKLWIENIAEPINSIDEDKEERIYTEFYSRQATLSLTNLKFEEAPLFSLRMNLLGEIVSANGFDSLGPLYIKYQINLPDLWELESKDFSDCLSGTTISASSTSSRLHFNHPLDLDLICRDTLSPPSWPNLNCVIYSTDFWNRVRIEGYAVIPLPRSSGCHSLLVHTWKPTETRVNTLSNYFLGGSRHLDLSELNHSWDNQQRINRFGFFTESTGSIRLNLTAILSSETYASKSCTDSMEGNLNLAVLSTALSRAKARLLALKAQDN